VAEQGICYKLTWAFKSGFRILGPVVVASTIFTIPLHAQGPGRFTRIVLSDSAVATIHLGGTDTSMMVYSPVGIFRLRADSSALAAWAKASERLSAPATPPNAAPGAPLALSAAILRATDQSGNAMRFIRLSGDSLPFYQLAVANGAWEFAERLLPGTARKIFVALQGLNALGPDTVRWDDYPPSLGAYPLDYRHAEPVAGTQKPEYPRHADFLRADGEVVASFTIDTTGRARPESLLIIRATHPLFSLSVRNALPAMRFVPATVNGKKVQETVVQTFEFRVPR
jgi:TonB family protein